MISQDFIPGAGYRLLQAEKARMSGDIEIAAGLYNMAHKQAIMQGQKRLAEVAHSGLKRTSGMGMAITEKFLIEGQRLMGQLRKYLGKEL